MTLPRRTAATGLVLTILCGLATAGPLNPPAGAVSSTMKPLTDVEPRTAINATNTPGDSDSVFKINYGGSYYLTGNVYGVSGKCGIEVAADNVTIDLNGFTLFGAPGSLSGVRTTLPDTFNVTVENGLAEDWGQSGIDLATNSPQRCTVRSVQSKWNLGNGIRVYQLGTIDHCIADHNTGIGIDAYPSSTITSCQVNANGTNGIDASSSTVISGCIATGNGINGILASNGSMITGCVASGNGQSGITASSQVTVTNNSVTNNVNGAWGIMVSGSDNRIEQNTCTGNTGGILVNGAGNLIVKNACADNNFNWSIVANNVYGPIINRSNPASLPVNGDSAPSTLATTDPNANFTY